MTSISKGSEKGQRSCWMGMLMSQIWCDKRHNGKKRKAFVSHQKDRKPGDTALMNINLNSQTLTNSLNAPVSVQQRPKAETDRDGCAWRGYCLLLCSLRVSLGLQKQICQWFWSVSECGKVSKESFQGCVSEGKVNTGSAIFHCWGYLGKRK